MLIRVQGEWSALQCRGEVVHAPDCSLQFQQEWRVVFLMFLQLLAGISKDIVVALLVGLGEDSAEASRKGPLVRVASGDEVVSEVFCG
jgi:hypothetical protein